MRLVRLVLLGMLWLPSGPARALDDQSVLWVSWVKPRPGMESEFETGLKAHHQWRRTQADPWVWLVWRIGSGPNTGTYAIGTFNHSWSDLDAPPVIRPELFYLPATPDG